MKNEILFIMSRAWDREKSLSPPKEIEKNHLKKNLKLKNLTIMQKQY